ncbi:laccase-2-like [Gossypium australe]|uniref:Laccase-2-like n=1 Tax=Gossypium australe TaxID=47621 RepID=A0A5B6VU04_9ROSI|nr:laccase-2-like [Gossypium australe]
MVTSNKRFIRNSHLVSRSKEVKRRFTGLEKPCSKSLKSLSKPTLYVKIVEKVTTLIVSLYFDDLLIIRSSDNSVTDFKL